jgi:hypothetical protein
MRFERKKAEEEWVRNNVSQRERERERENTEDKNEKIEREKGKEESRIKRSWDERKPHGERWT